jgi:hypothetical protein
MTTQNDDANRMMAVPVGATFDENFELRLYYAPTHRGYRKHQFLGLYTRKSVRAVGEIENVVTADLRGARLVLHAPRSGITPEQQEHIRRAMLLAKEHDWDITTGHNFFLVRHFVETDFRKSSHGGMRSTRYFNLFDELGTTPVDAVSVAAKLNGRSWE